MTRIADAANPQPGDRFTSGLREYRVTAVGEVYLLVVPDGDKVEHVVSRRTVASQYLPVLPPLITEPVVLHHYVVGREHTDGDRWGLSTMWQGSPRDLTHRKIELRPDGTWTELQ